MDRGDTAKFFVYGTLKRDQLRGAVWPRAAVAICSAVVRGELWDLGSFPGLTHGTDWCVGELWSIAIEDLSVTLSVLDDIEGYCESSDSGLYLRRKISVWYRDQNEASGIGVCEAQTYLFETPSGLQKARKIHPWMECPFGIALGGKVACWPDSRSRVPKRVSDELDPE